MNQLEQLKQRSLILMGLFLLCGGLAAQSTITDTVCAGSQDVFYGLTSSVPGSTFEWALSVPSAGTIDLSIAPNDSVIQIDWGMTSGTYTLSVVEINSNGCAGDTVKLDVVIEDLPSIASIEGDTVCSGDPSQMLLTFTGQAPWTVDYTDGTNNYQVIATTSPYTVTLPSYTSDTNIQITGLSDSGGCSASSGSLPSASVIIYSKPSTGAIYHY